MEHPSQVFDQLAKALAQGTSRREILRAIVGGMAGGWLAILGLGSAWGQAGSLRCKPGELPCGGLCVDPRIDPQNCGRCSNICPAGTVCINRQCGGGPAAGCPQGQVRCKESCVDPYSDELNCGGCGVTCGTDQTCCSGTCVNLQSDLAHCGACGRACAAGEECRNGQCIRDCLNTGSDCPSGQGCCCTQFVEEEDRPVCIEAICVDRQSDASHCGFCGGRCASGQSCVGGICTCTTASDCDYRRWIGATDCCSGVCHDIGSTNSHCGGCGIACAPSEFCYFGVCYCGNTGQCPPGQTCAVRFHNGNTDYFCG